nr:homocysteine S-methyltransferase family protein [uncultured Niameybacter sp.]
MGTVLQSKGLKLGEIPELFNFTHEELIEKVHSEYLEAGADCITTNTFGANRYKMIDTPYSVEEVITQAVDIAKRAVSKIGKGKVVLDIGSTGKLIEPVGDITFEEAYEVFKEQVVAGEKAGADIILFETFTDLYELKAGILAAKENTSLPIFCTMTFEGTGRTFFGTSLEAMVLTLEALGVDALGINCSLGPKELVPLVEKVVSLASIPVLIQPNAGLPTMKDGKAIYNITEEEFAHYMAYFAELGVSILGGCCGTNPSYIKKVVDKVRDIPVKKITSKKMHGICSSQTVVDFNDIRIIGERLNPTGKKLLQQALREDNMDYVLRLALEQKEEGADLLDVNMGLPDIDEVEMLKKAVKQIQGIVDLPLQIDSSNVDALEAAVRIYNGKPLINSVNGKRESLDAILPIAKKYGAAVLGLTLDEKGIPNTAEERLEVARRIVEAAREYGISKEDIFIDCLVVTASAQQDLVFETLRAVKLVKDILGVKTVLGVSNVSFGLPQRPALNQAMLTMALMQGLDAPILNPKNKEMIQAILAYRVLVGKDKESKDYIKYFSSNKEDSKEVMQDTNYSLEETIIKGLKDEAGKITRNYLKSNEPLEIVEKFIVPALNKVGEDYEKQVLYLPQLIKSAEAAQSSFEVLKVEMLKQGETTNAGPKVVLATVHGDIHDIGKNIVKVIMQNYGFTIIDLGKDVSTDEVLKAVEKYEVKLVGLSALMTTTVTSMKETIEALKTHYPECKVVVGGAVLTQDLADFVGADFYAKDAMETVRIGEEVLKNLK